MCLYVFVSRGCFRHRSALANGFFVASISIPFALFVSLSLSLTCSFVLSVSYFPTNYNNSALRRSLSLFSSSSQSVSVACSFSDDMNTLWRQWFAGKSTFKKSPPLKLRWLFSSVVYTRARIRAIKSVSLLLIVWRAPAFSLSLFNSLLTARVRVFVGGHINALETKSNLFPTRFIPFGLCKSERV